MVFDGMQWCRLVQPYLLGKGFDVAVSFSELHGSLIEAVTWVQVKWPG